MIGLQIFFIINGIVDINFEKFKFVGYDSTTYSHNKLYIYIFIYMNTM